MKSKAGDPKGDFLAAFQAGRVLLHPTDGLYGLGVDPSNDKAVARLNEIKGRLEGKGFVGLVSSFEKAELFYEPLPPWAKKMLSLCWPGPLSVVFKAHPLVPSHLLGPDQTVCLRVPQLSHSHWFLEVLKDLSVPFPSTSVNPSGASPIVSGLLAKEWLSGFSGVYIPDELVALKGAQASTLIKLEKDHFVILRQGAFAEALVQEAFQSSWQ